MKWSPFLQPLISGKRDAVLVDTAITVDQNQKLVDWMAASGKNLTTIYATHGHGDHFFGVNTIQKKFPKARFVATREVIAVMQKQASAPVVNTYWKPRFPGQIDSTLEVADALKEALSNWKGSNLWAFPRAYRYGQHDLSPRPFDSGWSLPATPSTTMFIFIWASRTPKPGTNWIAALDKIESLKPVAVIAGHKRPGAPDTPNNIEETRKYIRDFDRIATNTKTASELYNQMLAIYPERVNPAVCGCRHGQ